MWKDTRNSLYSGRVSVELELGEHAGVMSCVPRFRSRSRRGCPQLPAAWMPLRGAHENQT